MLGTSPGKPNQPKNWGRREAPRDDLQIQVSVCRFKMPNNGLHRGGQDRDIPEPVGRPFTLSRRSGQNEWPSVSCLVVDVLHYDIEHERT